MTAAIEGPGDIVQATAAFERWASRHVRLIRSDVKLKHRNMASAAFPFLRATFYRWAQLWPLLCPELARAARVLAVGDLHIENFGTWRDLEGRLIWGVNDFDEVWPAAYTVDLMRLATSAYLAIDALHLSLKRKEAWRARSATGTRWRRAGVPLFWQSITVGFAGWQ